jgi:2,4-dienoyl-CoA reductase (NADPH2)
MLNEFDEIVLATGVLPRTPEIDGVGHPSVLSYIDVLADSMPVGKRVALIGAGGIGFDVAEFLSHARLDNAAESGPDFPNTEEFTRQWGIDMSLQAQGGVKDIKPQPDPSPREIWLLQRKTSKLGKSLGKTTGWAHRLELKQKGVNMLAGVSYRRIDDEGLHITMDGEEKLLAVDNVVICAGQVSRRDLQQALQDAGKSIHLIGGVDLATELDAKRAIKQGAELAAVI